VVVGVVPLLGGEHGVVGEIAVEQVVDDGAELQCLASAVQRKLSGSGHASKQDALSCSGC